MIVALGLALVLALADLAHAQIYSRCVDATGRVHLSDGEFPPGVRCVSRVTKELPVTPEPAARPVAAKPGQHALWITDPAGTIRVRTYENEETCQAAREARIASPNRLPIDSAYRCMPAGITP